MAKISKESILKVSFVFVLALMVLVVGAFYRKVEGNNILRNVYALAYDSKDYVYLSDIGYKEDETYVESGYYLRLDKNNSSGLITLNVKGEKREFIKGIAAWATSSLVYDLTNLDYDYFVTYLGVDAKETSTYYNSGVTFTIYTSSDGTEWKEAYKSGIKKGWDDADYVEIPLEGVKYLKLYAYENGDSWYSMWYDDAVYADAKLVKEGYVEDLSDDNTVVKKVADYDAIIKKYEDNIKKGDFSNIDEYKLTLLQRDFVNNVGYGILQALLRYSDEYKEVLSWLMNDSETLELYVLGGAPDGNYASSLKILNSLYKKYKDTDLKNENLTSEGVKYQDLYKKMIVTLSLTHSANVGLWVTGAPEDPDDPNGSNALKRYEIYKELKEKGLLIDNIYDHLAVEEMRFVMNNIIDDEEIIWLNHYTTENNSTNPYTYITYRFGYEYNNPKYYVLDDIDMWNNKKRGNLPYAYNFKDYNITYKEGYPKLWVVFEEGSVCGGLSKTGSNIWGSYGVPSSVVSQPGHAAYIYMSLDDNGNKVWNLYNDVSGWGQSGKTEKLSVRMPNGWGSGDYAGGFPASYVILSTAALKDYDKYALAEEILMSTSTYESDYETLENIYKAALDVQNINFDAWLGLVRTYEKQEKTEEEYYNLALQIVDALGNYPLPMHDLLRIIDTHLNDAIYQAKFIKLVNDALTNATKENKEVVNDNVKRQVANYLLNANKDAVATFSFDGEDAGKIVLSKSFEGNGVTWQYNITSNLLSDDWKEVSGLSYELSEDEINLIHSETDIHIRIVGALDVIYDIPIEKSLFPASVSINDNENIFAGLNDTMEWKYSDSLEWNKFSEKEPDLNGDVSVDVRVGRNKNYTESDLKTFTFTSNGESDEDKYVSIKRLTVAEVSTEEPGKSNGKENAIDGNVNTMWHTAWDGSDKDKFIVLELDEPAYISSLEYVPRQSSTNGIVTNAKVLVSIDNEDWTTAVESTKWDLNNLSKKVTFDNVIKAKYVKVIGVETSGSYMSAAMINLFEDTTRKIAPTADVEYSTNSLTNKDVVAKLVNPSKKITMINPKGSDTYTFTENGEFTFEFVDEDGNVGKTVAKVDWIDKVAPKVSIKYSTTEKTNGIVVAEVISDEDITVINNDHYRTYPFKTNGSFEFVVADKAGNETRIKAEVTWIEEIKEDNENDSKTDIPSNKEDNDVSNNDTLTNETVDKDNNNNVNDSTNNTTNNSNNNSSVNNNNNTNNSTTNNNNNNSSNSNNNEDSNVDSNHSDAYENDKNNSTNDDNKENKENKEETSESKNKVSKRFVEMAIMICSIGIVVLTGTYVILKMKK